MPVNPKALSRLGIRDAQRAYWPDGHIRIGHLVSSRNGGEHPAKLSTFRFSSPSRSIIVHIADKYGGTVEEMKRGHDKWQVTTNAIEVEVLVPPQSVTTWLELWNRGNFCERRCDGEGIEQKSGRPCLCKDEGVQRCVLTTRLTVMLADIPSLGYWLLTSRGVNAFRTLPGRAEFASMAGPYTVATLYMQEGRSIVEGKPAEYMVPLLRIEGEGDTEDERLTPRKVIAGSLVDRRSVGASTSAPPALDSAPRPDYLTQARAATTAAQVGAIWETAARAGHLDEPLRAALTAIGQARRNRENAQSASTQSAPARKPLSSSD